jgi:hypothetical protein
VVLSSVAARRWGARLGGILVTIPIVAGPILLIIYLQPGGRFAAGAATAATLANVSLAAFALTLILVLVTAAAEAMGPALAGVFAPSPSP